MPTGPDDTRGDQIQQDVDPEKALSDNDSFPALEAGGALLITGPTGTNVNDVRVALIS